MQQAGPGQPGSPMRAEAVRVNPKTGAADVIGPQVIQMLDKQTGTRPTPVAPPDPNAKPAKPRQEPYRPPPTTSSGRASRDDNNWYVAGPLHGPAYPYSASADLARGFCRTA